MPIAPLGNSIPLCLCSIIGNAGEAIAILEHPITNAGDAVGVGVTGEIAIVERIRASGGDAIRDGNTREFSATTERRRTNYLCIIMNGTKGNSSVRCFYQHQIGIASVAKIICSAVSVICQTCAIRERRIAYAGDAIGDNDAGEAGASIKRIIANAGDAIGDNDAGEASAICERRRINYLCIIMNGTEGNRSTRCYQHHTGVAFVAKIICGVVSVIRQTCATRECTGTNACDAIGNGHAG